MSRHPLNQAVIAQVLFDLKNGQLRRSLDLGFDEEDIRQLKDPEWVSMLLNTSVRWSTVIVHSDVLKRLKNRTRDSEKEIVFLPTEY